MTKQENQINVAIAGLGTVGIGTYKILTQKRELFKAKTGKDIVVSAISSRSKSKDRGVDFPNDINWFDNPVDMTKATNVDVVVEAIGGEDGIAYALAKEALSAGKSFVTANKAMIAIHGAELAKLAEDNGGFLCFESAVAGGIPILKVIREGLAANEFVSISGIMNGTCNFILTEMAARREGFEPVLADAQAKGYAETPPDLDIDGVDTAHKLAIISALAFGAKLNFDGIILDGIRKVTLDDIDLAKDFGYKIKLLGTVKKADNNELLQMVQPTLVKADSQIGQVDGVLNAIYSESDEFGGSIITGAGAGEKPTASSVVADIIDIAANRAGKAFYASNEVKSVKNYDSRFYYRINLEDKAGTLAEITSILSSYGISIDEVAQKVHNTGDALVGIITHETNADSARDAIAKLESLEFVNNVHSMVVSG